jgi:hypothetical protein
VCWCIIEFVAEYISILLAQSKDLLSLIFISEKFGRPRQKSVRRRWIDFIDVSRCSIKQVVGLVNKRAQVGKLPGRSAGRQNDPLRTRPEGATFASADNHMAYLSLCNKLNSQTSRLRKPSAAPPVGWGSQKKDCISELTPDLRPGLQVKILKLSF